MRSNATPRLLLTLAALAACLPPPAAAQDVPPVVRHITVTDRDGRFVKGLARESFAVYEGGAEREVISVSQEDAPVSLGVVFDMSASMTAASGQELDAARRALADFHGRSHPANEYFVLGFAEAPRLLADWSRAAGPFVAGLNALPSMQKKGTHATALYDALYEGLEKVRRGAHAKRVVLVVSDGADNGSRRKLADVRRLAAETGALIYALAVYAHAGQGAGGAPLRRLEELCRATGGRVFYVESYHPMWRAQAVAEQAKVGLWLQTLALELRTQYAVAFRAAAGGDLRRVEVKVGQPAKRKNTVARLEVYVPATPQP